MSKFAIALCVAVVAPFIAQSSPLIGRFLAGLVLAAAWVIYFLGCKEYLRSKGYLGLWLWVVIAFAAVPGFLIMLLLPDLKVLGARNSENENT